MGSSCRLCGLLFKILLVSFSMFWCSVMSCVCVLLGLFCLLIYSDLLLEKVWLLGVCGL